MEKILTGCIYAIRNVVNNHYYIGQTRLRNPIIRWKDHFDSAYLRKEKYHLYQAMRKYGIEKFSFQILEDDIPIEELDQKEKDYIIKYNSYNDGYNNTEGGQDSSWHSKLTEEQVKEIIHLIHLDTPFVKIAEYYNVNPSTISDINTGDSWHFSNIDYPIVNKDNKKHFTEEEIQNIYERLRQGESAKSISLDYQTSKTTISNINNGKIYKHEKEEYPIYKAINSSKHLEVEQITKIIHYLITTKNSYTQISNILGIGRKTISNIDQGKGYLKILNQLGYTHFPLRVPNK